LTTTVFAKPAPGTSKTVSRQLPAGRYRVSPQAVVSHGVLYRSPSHPTVTVAAGRPVRITVEFSRVPSASSLQATSISTTSISLAWSAPQGATFAAAPGTLLPAPADVHAATATGSGVRVTLSPGITAPVIGSVIVLPQSASLPGGYLGRVSGISADGSTLTLQPASLSDAFSCYNLAIPHYASAATALTLAPGRNANAARPGAVTPG
jgi:hypothetical protein